MIVTDLYYVRSTDGGETWSDTANLATRNGVTIEEKEVESFASPDGKSIYNVWLQEEEEATSDLSDPFSGLDSWFGRVDYTTLVPETEPVTEATE